MCSMYPHAVYAIMYACKKIMQKQVLFTLSFIRDDTDLIKLAHTGLVFAVCMLARYVGN